MGVTIIHYVHSERVVKEQTKLIKKKKCQRERNIKENLPSASSLVSSLTVQLSDLISVLFRRIRVGEKVAAQFLDFVFP